MHEKRKPFSSRIKSPQPTHRKEDFPMTDFTTDIAQALVRKEDLQEVFRSHLEAAINTLLATELTAFLDYEKYDRVGFGSGNSRNGTYARTLHTEFGDLQLTIP